MSNPSSPEISIVLATDTWETIRPVVENLRRTQPVDRIELILVSPDAKQLRSDSEALGDFGHFIAVEHPAPPLHEARAAGVMAAGADRVFIGETHSFARPGMVEALLAAHDEGWEIVVPRLENANPVDYISWANFITDYGAWAGELSRGPSKAVPVYNASFDRRMLQDLGDDLALSLGQGDMVNHTLGLRRIFHEPEARIGHVNLCTARPGLTERFLVGVMTGSRRLERWSRLRGLAYAAASPLIAATLIARTWPHYRRLGHLQTLPFGTLVGIVANCSVRALGEMVGYLGYPDTQAEHHQDLIEISKLKMTRLS